MTSTTKEYLLKELGAGSNYVDLSDRIGDPSLILDGHFGLDSMKKLHQLLGIIIEESKK
jgi:hypothetical protein